MASFGCPEEVVPLGVELIEFLLGVRSLPRPLVRLDDLASGVVEGVHRRLVGLDVIDHHLQFGKLHLNDLRVTVHRFKGVKGLVGPLDPDQELVEGMLELSQPEEGVLKLLLSVVDGLDELRPISSCSCDAKMIGGR